MMRRLWFFVLALFVLIASAVQAQTPSFKINWNQLEPPGVASTFQYTLQVDAGTATALTPTCVAQGTGSICTGVFPKVASGTHTVVVTAFNGFGSASSTPLAGAPPSIPTGISVTVTITIP